MLTAALLEYLDLLTQVAESGRSSPVML